MSTLPHHIAEPWAYETSDTRPFPSLAIGARSPLWSSGRCVTYSLPDGRQSLETSGVRVVCSRFVGVVAVLATTHMSGFPRKCESCRGRGLRLGSVETDSIYSFSIDGATFNFKLNGCGAVVVKCEACQGQGRVLIPWGQIIAEATTCERKTPWGVRDAWPRHVHRRRQVGATWARDAIAVKADELQSKGSRWGVWLAAIIEDPQWGEWHTYPLQAELEREVAMVARWDKVAHRARRSRLDGLSLGEARAAFATLSRKTGEALVPAFSSLASAMRRLIHPSQLAADAASQVGASILPYQQQFMGGDGFASPGREYAIQTSGRVVMDVHSDTTPDGAERVYVDEHGTLSTDETGVYVGMVESCLGGSWLGQGVRRDTRTAWRCVVDIQTGESAARVGERAGIGGVMHPVDAARAFDRLSHHDADHAIAADMRAHALSESRSETADRLAPPSPCLDPMPPERQRGRRPIGRQLSRRLRSRD